MLGWLLGLMPGWTAAQANSPAGVDALQLQLQLQPAWQGYVKSGVAHSELSVGFKAPRNGWASATVIGASMRVSRDFPVEPAQPVSLSLPLVHDSLQPLQVEVHLDGKLLAQQQLELVVLPASARLVAVVAGMGTTPAWTPHPGADYFSQENLTLLNITPRELPVHAQSYAQLSALILSGSVLAALSSAQVAALGEYLGACGKLFLTDSSAVEEATLRAFAGCGGSQLMAGLPASSVDITAHPASPLPGVATLRQLVPGAHYGVVQTLLIFLLGYLGLLLLAARTATRVLPLLMLPLAATGLALLAWSLSNPFLQAVAWAEMNSGDPSLRYVGLLQVMGTSRQQVPLTLSGLTGVPHPVEPMGVAGLHYGLHYGNAEEPARLSLETRLLSRHEFVFNGTAPGVMLEVFGDSERARVTNRGAGASPPAVVAWRGLRFSVPALAAGQSWQPAAPVAAEPWGDAPQEQLLRQKAMGGGTWLLLPLDIAALRPWQEAGAKTSWLLVKGAEDA